jgi:4-amino-4-deoxy-L-arabinose transferase-like glycosyltransferase
MTRAPEPISPPDRQVEPAPAADTPRPIAAWVDHQGVRLPVVVGLLIRVLLITVLFHWDAVPSGSDDATYVRFAQALLQTGALATHHFPVGYPLFIAPFLALGSLGFPAIRIVHVVLGCLTILLVSQIARRLYGRRASLLAAWLTALYPPLAFMTGRIMSETLFITLLVASLLQFLISDRNESTTRSVVAGALLAVASIVRSNLVAMLPFIPVWYLLKRGSPFRERLFRACACSAVAFVLLMLPGVYFRVTTGEFLPFATNAGQTFYGANNPLATGGWIEVNDHPELLASIPPAVRRSPSAFSKAQQQLGVKWIRQNPAAFLRLLPRKFANAWLPGFQSSETTTHSKLAAVLLAFSSGVVLIGAIAGRLLFKPAERDGLLLAVLATYTVMSLAFYGNPRIGLFCSPILIVYASASVRRLFDNLSQRAS